MKRYYIDTSIWMDLYENRKGFNQEPLGDFALRLFAQIRYNHYKLIITDLTVKELESNYSIAEINGMMKPFENILDKIIISKKQRNDAYVLSIKRGIPKGDVLHAIIARDNDLILITRDNHFKKLKDISISYKPEEII